MTSARAAGIDVGTNSFLLLIIESDGQGGETVLLDRSDITRLGEGVDAERRLQPEPMDRCAGQLAEYMRLCTEHRVSAVSAVGTSALRDATNRDEFLARVERECGLRIEVITGEREAELTYAAVARQRQVAGTLANVDIGGGSTELVLGEGGRIASRVSLDIGAVRATDRAGQMSDPPTTADLARLRAVADEALDQVPAVQAEVCGTGGTITTLAAIWHGLTTYDAAVVESTRLTPAMVDALTARLAALPLAQRRQVPGLPAKRADVILGGCVVLSALMARLAVAEMGVSAGGLRYALAREALCSVAGAGADATADGDDAGRGAPPAG
ncbi:MAG: Ppx/GppA family phosphatase [Armatimonadetes bacterium]|nr:Ppx/GppA family phosphatase [Armatimonadota bacterium]